MSEPAVPRSSDDPAPIDLALDGLAGFRPSATALAWGVALLIVGPAAIAIGASSDMPFWNLLGLAALIAGAINLVIGVSRIASHIDNMERDRRARIDAAR